MTVLLVDGVELCIIGMDNPPPEVVDAFLAEYGGKASPVEAKQPEPIKLDVTARHAALFAVAGK